MPIASAAALLVPPSNAVASDFFITALKHSLIQKATMLYSYVSNLYHMKNYGERLSEALRLAGKERQELADGINISVQAIGQVIAGKTKALTAENSALAAVYLGVDVFWLATGRGSPSQKSNETSWPFSISADLFFAMPAEERAQIDKHIKLHVNDWHQGQHVKSKKTG